MVLFIGVAGALTVAFLRDVFSMSGTELLGGLSDSFTIPGAILVSVGGLLWVAGDGFFDMLSYGLKNGLHALLPVYKLEQRSFYDYKVARMEKREKGAFVPFLLVGLAFLLISLVLYIFYSII